MIITKGKECQANVYFGINGQSANTTCNYLDNGKCLLDLRTKETMLPINRKRKFTTKVDTGICLLKSQNGIPLRLS